MTPWPAFTKILCCGFLSEVTSLTLLITNPQLANAFNSLADQFQLFHDSGLEHYQAATKMMSCVQDISGVCNASLGQAVSVPMQKVCAHPV